MALRHFKGLHHYRQGHYDQDHFGKISVVVVTEFNGGFISKYIEDPKDLERILEEEIVILVGFLL